MKGNVDEVITILRTWLSFTTTHSTNVFVLAFTSCDIYLLHFNVHPTCIIDMDDSVRTCNYCTFSVVKLGPPNASAVFVCCLYIFLVLSDHC